MRQCPFYLAAEARLDLLRTWNHLAEQLSYVVAEKVLADIEKAILKLAKSPQPGHRRQDLTTRDLRFFLVDSYFVIYRPDKRPLNVVRVIHSARDIKSMMGE